MLIGTEPTMGQVLEESCRTAASKLYDLITDRFGSHVVRRMLVVAAGTDVTPAQVMHDGAEATRTWKVSAFQARCLLAHCRGCIGEIANASGVKDAVPCQEQGIVSVW